MLRLENIVKEYPGGDNNVVALKGVNLEFRKNEFVSILGPSGCGKTTMLNIIGGLDKYTSGDLIINGISTTKYKDSDWDTYRNHSIGFVFQSYNLIPHQSVLANVELALTLSGVSKRERKKRAIEALDKVGLHDQIHKRPNQLSGGQMQRVAIARALVNNPDILLADEPTGALDSDTSTQIMDILAEIAEEKLVIMVTHNPELAMMYSTRIIKLLDGNVIADSSPVEEEEKMPVLSAEELKKRPKLKKTSMGFFTALSLSFNNLLTKKARTVLTAFAGSIGIIGIALILSLSNGVQDYIDKVEEDTLSSYPIMVQKESIDMTSFMTTMAGTQEEDKTGREPDLVYTNQIMTTFMDTMLKEVESNNLSDFRSYIENNRSLFDEYVTDIQYTYSTTMNIYRTDTENGLYQVNPSHIFDGFGSAGSSGSYMVSNSEVWQRFLDNDDLLRTQYEVAAGRFPEKYDEVALIISGDNEITDYTLYCLGILDSSELTDTFTKMVMGEDVSFPEPKTYTYDELLDVSFKLLLNTDYYEKQGNIWVSRADDEVFLLSKLEDALEIKIVGILRSSSDAAMSNLAGTIGYRTDLMEYLIDEVNSSEIVNDQKNNPDTDIFTGIRFTTDEAEEYSLTMDELAEYLKTLPADDYQKSMEAMDQMTAYGMSDERILETFAASMPHETTDATYDNNLHKMGVSDLNNPSSINLYPKDFASKDYIADLIADYNDSVEDENKISYTDYVGLIMSSVTTIINAISYILIAFVAISLVVSSIMIGIITYISVLERTKEIGILRAVGASKRDVSRVFNAETLIVGFTAGAMGILITELLLIPINAIILKLTDISGLAALPSLAGVILVGISMLLTFIAGLLPSRVAAKKDPVVALRTE